MLSFKIYSLPVQMPLKEKYPELQADWQVVPYKTGSADEQQ
jgi:hypothetical protein